MTAGNALRLALIGFGEAGGCLARDLVRHVQGFRDRAADLVVVQGLVHLAPAEP